MFQTRLILTALIGASIIGRMAYLYAGNDTVALGVTLLIGLGFGLGLLEIRRFMTQLGSWRGTCQTLEQSDEDAQAAACLQPHRRHPRRRQVNFKENLPIESLTSKGNVLMVSLPGAFTPT